MAYSKVWAEKVQALAIRGFTLPDAMRVVASGLVRLESDGSVRLLSMNQPR